MSRSGYNDDIDPWALIRWRGAVASAMRGRKGQAFLKEMLAALDALPKKELIARKLECEGEVCALGALGKARGIDMAVIDPECPEQIAGTFGIADAMAREIMFENDEDFTFWSPKVEEATVREARFLRMRNWIASLIKS